ncbi:MAG: hypothetical protein GY867_00575, partial [bacterium]|nr:hypothetical protein [bacterium]
MVEGMKEYDDMPTLGPIFWLSVGWIVFIVFCAASVDLWPLPESDHMDFMNLAALPGAEGEVSIVQPDGKEITTRYRYLFGADAMGRDIFTRLVFGARVSLAVGLA